MIQMVVHVHIYIVDSVDFDIFPVLFIFCFFPWLDREKDEDEGIPSETEDDKKQLETKAKEMRGERNMFTVFE